MKIKLEKLKDWEIKTGKRKSAKIQQKSKLSKRRHKIWVRHTRVVTAHYDVPYPVRSVPW